MRESKYTSDVGDLLPSDVYKLKINLRYARGVADSWYSGKRGDLWVEWKYLKSVPKTVNLVDGNDPIITRLQQSWLRDRYEEGRSVAVIVGSKQGGAIFQGLTWQEPLTKEEFNKRLVSKRELAHWINSQVGV